MHLPQIEWRICLEYSQCMHLPQIEWKTYQRHRPCMHPMCSPQIARRICQRHRQCMHWPQIEWNTYQRHNRCKTPKNLHPIEQKTCPSHMQCMCLKCLPQIELRTIQQHMLACQSHHPHRNTQQDIACRLRRQLRPCSRQQSISDRCYCWRHRKCPRRSWRDISVS